MCSSDLLVPNMKGLEAAIAADVKEVAAFAAATESFSMKNTNCSIAQSLERLGQVCDAALAAKLRVRGYISCVLGCPYEGEVDPNRVADVARALYQMGCYEVSLGDTIGTGTAARTQAVFEACAKHVPMEKLAGHFHDTDRAEHPISQLGVCIVRIQGSDTIHVEPIGIDVRRQRINGCRPNPIRRFLHWVGFAVQFSIYRHLLGIGRIIAQRQRTIGSNFR